MRRARWSEVKPLLGRVLQAPPDERAPLIEAACAGRPDLRTELDALLRCDAEMGDFLERPLFEPHPARGAENSVPADLRAWTRYEVIERLGCGGAAVVYKARDPQLGRMVALKIIDRADAATLRRFLREARAQAGIDHDNVVKVYDTGMVGRRHYIAMQLVDGPTLLGVRDETTLEQKVRIVLAVADALHAAHRTGLVHRDIKPGNIMVQRSEDGVKPYVGDFGLAVEAGDAALTGTGLVLGTPRYMSPERIRGGTAALDRRSDIFSLGATFYEFVCGVPPFAGEHSLDVLTRILAGEYVPLRTRAPGLPQEIDAIVGKCLEHDPNRRYASAQALADDLRRYLDGRPITARPIGVVRRWSRRARRQPALSAMFAAMIVAIALTAGWAARESWRSRRQAFAAQEIGRDVGQIEWVFRAAQMSPLHAIGPQQQVRARMVRLQDMMASGVLDPAVGEYALGRALLALGSIRPAVDHLSRAWSGGFQTADAAAALGVAEAELFRLERDRAMRLPDRSARQERLRAIEAAHRDRAVTLLQRAGASDLFSPSYLSAVAAAYSGRSDEAIARAAAALRETPWLFEAPLLAGHIELARARERYAAGDPVAALPHAEAADRHYGEAERIAPSSIDARLGRCASTGLVLHMILHRLPHDPEPLRARADESCRAALAIDPDRVLSHKLAGEAIRFWGSIQVLRNRDPGDAFDRAARHASRAAALEPDDPELEAGVAAVWLERAWWESRTGRDPRPSIESVVEGFERAIARGATVSGAANDIGQVLLLKARYESARGLDPRPALRRAVATLERALTADPHRAFPARNLVRATVQLAAEDARRGINPVPGVERVLALLRGLPGTNTDPVFQPTEQILCWYPLLR